MTEKRLAGEVSPDLHNFPSAEQADKAFSSARRIKKFTIKKFTIWSKGRVAS